MKKFGILLIFLFFPLILPVFAQTDELIILLNVQINQDNSDFITGNVFYESENELNKKRIYIFVLAVFLLLSIVLILKKSF